MKLVLKGTQAPVEEGHALTTFRGEPCTLVGWREPHKPSSTGRIFVRFIDREYAREFFPSVCGLEFIP